MRKSLSMLLVFILVLTASLLPAYAEEQPEASAPAAQVLQDNLVVTEHEAVIQGQRVPYTATTGTMALSSSFGQYEIFFTAYTRSDVDDLSFTYYPSGHMIYLDAESLDPLHRDAQSWYGAVAAQQG